MFDASPKFPVGALYGSFYQLGNFDQCISIEQPKEELFSPIQRPVKGKYCLTDIAIFSASNRVDRVARSYMNVKVNSSYLIVNSMFQLNAFVRYLEADLTIRYIGQFAFQILVKSMILKISWSTCLN